MTALRTPRLVLRRTVAADLDAIAAAYAGQSWPGQQLITDDEAREMADRRVAGTDGVQRFTIERDGEVIGDCCLWPSKELPGGAPELGWLIGDRFRGQGYAAEAVRGLLEHCFGAAGLSVAWALVHPDNTASLRAAARAGMRDVGVGDYYGSAYRVLVAMAPVPRGFHHVELWVAELDAAVRCWGWLLGELGWTEYQNWPRGRSWRLGASYLVVEDSADRDGDRHQRTRPGLNHVALHVPTAAQVQRLVADAPANGWQLMFADRHPHAGGPDHYAAYLENAEGFEVELVAADYVSAPSSAG